MFPKKNLCLIILFAFVYLSMSCSPNDAGGIEPSTIEYITDIQNINSGITITYLDFRSTGKIGSEIYLMMENHTKDSITFPLDYGSSIYEYQDIEETWIEVDNSITYDSLAGDAIILTPENETAGNTRLIMVLPEIVNDGYPVTVRIMVVGTIIRNNGLTNERVNAYVDIVLYP